MREPDDPVRAVEALLFAAEEPLTLAEIGEMVGGEAAAAARLQAEYAGRGVELVERGGRWHFQTAADLAPLLRRERRSRRSAACRWGAARSTY